MVNTADMVSVGEGPIANTEGTQYTNIDTMTGRPIQMRRITEKWSSGEAL